MAKKKKCLLQTLCKQNHSDMIVQGSKIACKLSLKKKAYSMIYKRILLS